MNIMQTILGMLEKLANAAAAQKQMNATQKQINDAFTQAIQQISTQLTTVEAHSEQLSRIEGQLATLDEAPHNEDKSENKPNA